MSDPLPFELVQQVTAAYFVSRCLQVAAELGVADALGDEPATASALANATGSHPASLCRVLDLLSGHGFFERRGDGFVHTPASRLLRTNDPQSMRSFVRMFGLSAFWKSAEGLNQVVATGQLSDSVRAQGGFWGYLANNPDASRIFDEAMAAKARSQMTAVAATYDFSGFGLIGDIGGGRGHLLEAILAASPRSRGVLFDLPRVIEQASDRASDRLTLRAGDFFKDELPVCDAYVLMEVIHDWGDEQAEQILKAVRRSAPPQAKLLLIEAVIPDRPGPSWTRTLDIAMLTMLGGIQRSYVGYQNLLARSGFRLERDIDLGADLSIFEASVA